MTRITGLRLRRGTCRWAIACCAVMAASGAQAKTVAVASPDGKVQAVLSDVGGKLQYRVTIDGRAILDPSPLAMKVDGVDLGNAAQIGTVQRKVVNSRYRFLGGKAEAIDKANVASVALTARGIRFEADETASSDAEGDAIVGVDLQATEPTAEQLSQPPPQFQHGAAVETEHEHR